LCAQITALKGLVEAKKANALAQGRPASFDEWIVRVMGAGIADLFMRPYNFKARRELAQLVTVQQECAEHCVRR
jgi:protoporphyrinogen oxidase